MKRLIALFFLAATLFVLMGCGSNSKSTIVEDTTRYTLTEGEYELAEPVVLERLAGLSAKKELRAQHEAELKSVEEELSSLTLVAFSDPVAFVDSEEQRKGLAERHGWLVSELKTLEDEIVALRIHKMSFSVHMNETGEYEVSGLSLETDLDKAIYRIENADGEAVKKDEEGNLLFAVKDEAGLAYQLGAVDQETGNPLSIELAADQKLVFDHTELFFAEAVKTGGPYTAVFNWHTGALTFAFVRGDRDYAVEGKIRDSVISGNMIVSDHTTGEELELGSWKMIYNVMKEARSHVAEAAKKVVTSIQESIQEMASKIAVTAKNIVEEEKSESENK